MDPVVVFSVRITWKIFITYFSAALSRSVYSLILRKNSDALSPSSVLYTPIWIAGSLVFQNLPLISTCHCLFFGESGSLETSAFLKIKSLPSQL